MSSVTAEDFWKWFASNQARFRRVRGPDKERLLDEILDHLHAFCPRLFFQIGGAPGESTELIVSAAGRAEFFPAVSDLVAAAPTMPGWCFIAFVPPAGFDFVTEYEDVKVDPKKAWFVPLMSPGAPGSLGLHVAVADFDAAKAATFESAALIVLQTGLGELVAGRDIHYVEVGAVPSNPEEEGYIKLIDLPLFMDRYLNRESAHE